ncbi:hypothetical protein [Candidatus Nitrospira neomarina]|uniref:Uncharacterized protein n=1 Tax=Candidatus Nitrospira neomarina TaxID=3020899 RepID=A0AA96JUR7_9BACT|nr:hypothetical protein [Candidatus Nitrospira neomarina]WNM60748.1 hypothetical protein PQG83_13380 [Candidatus Nitrospira neomarina]
MKNKKQQKNYEFTRPERLKGESMKFIKVYGSNLLLMGAIVLMVIGCVRVKVETSGQGPGISGLPPKKIPPVESCQVPSFAQQSEVIHFLKVTKHSDVDLTPKESDEILEEATKAAREGQGSDFPCRITLKREASVQETIGGTIEDKIADFKMDPIALSQSNSNDCFVFGEICSEFDFQILNALDPQGVKVVEEITWCEKTGTALILGCSNLKGHSVAVAKYCKDCPELEGVLWLHEFGHNKNLGHRGFDDLEKGVMYPSIHSENTSLNECECQNLRRK